MLQTNKNIQNLKPSATLAINQKVQELRAKGKQVYHFGFGQSPFPIHHTIVKALQNNASNNHYLPTLGLHELQNAIAYFLKHHQNISEVNRIFIGPGSKELLYQTLLILEGTFLIPKGSWVSYLPQIKSKNGDYVILNTTFKNSFKLTPEVLEHYCNNHKTIQKTLILNSPNNPTGAVYTAVEYSALAKVCSKHNLIVLSDEIYSQINYTNHCAPSISNYYPERTIVFGGLSKVFSAGGYRLGFMTLPKKLEALHPLYKSLFSETFSAVASPIQYAAIEAYAYNDDLQQYIFNSKTILSGIANFVYSSLNQYAIEVVPTNGGFYTMIGFNTFREKLKKRGIYTNTDLATFILEEYQVALLPGSDFYLEDNELFLRLAFVDFDGEKVITAFQKENLVDQNFIKKYCPNIFNGIIRIQKFVKELEQ